MNRMHKLAAATLSVYLALNGCAADDKVLSPVPVSGNMLTPAVIATSMQGSEAAASILQIRDFIRSSTSMYVELARLAQNHMDDTALSDQNTDISCADGGTYKYTGTYSTAAAYDLTFTFSGCRQDSFQYEGEYKARGVPSSMANTMGGSSTLNVFYFNSDYSVLVSYLKTRTSYTLTGTGTSANATYTITSNGSMSSFDYFLLDTFTFLFADLTVNYSLTTNAVTGDRTINLNANGDYVESWTRGNFQVTLQGFGINTVKTVSPAVDDTSLGGTLVFNYRPNGICVEGMYNVATLIPARFDRTLNYYTQGTLLINNIATVQYNAAGDINVSVPASMTMNFSREYSLMKECDFSAMEEVLPPLLPPPPAGSPATVTGNVLTVTLTWFGGATSDMDTHMEFYDTLAPTSADTPAWHVYFGTGVNCTEAGINFYGAVDVDGDGMCDVGLDFDDVEGYGPEHITALKLQTGYYVIYIHNWSLDSDPFATIYSSVHVGDNIFAPYTATFNSTTPGYYAVADVRVNGDGTINVMAHDTSLLPYPPYP